MGVCGCVSCAIMHNFINTKLVCQVVNAVSKPVLYVMCKPRLKCSLGSLARWSTLS